MSDETPVDAVVEEKPEENNSSGRVYLISDATGFAIQIVVPPGVKLVPPITVFEAEPPRQNGIILPS